MALARFNRNSIFGTIAGLSSAVGSFLGSVIVARLLGPEGSGLVALGIWLTGTCVTFADLGLPLTVSRFIPELSALRQDEEAAAFGRFFFRPVLMSAVVVSVIFLGLALFGAQWLRRTTGFHLFETTDDSIWFAIAAVFAAQAVGNFGLAQLRGEQRFVEAARLSSLFLPVQLLGMAVGSVLNGAEGALFGYASGSLATFGAAWTLLRGERTLGSTLKARAWRFSMGAWWVEIVSAIVWSRTEIAFLDYWRGPTQTGHYAVALTLAQVASQAPLLMTGGLLGFFTERHALADRAGLRRAFLASTRFCGFVLLPACFGMAAITPVMLPALFGAKFETADNAATVLVAAQAFGAMSVVSSTMMFAIERGGFLAKTGIIGIILILVSGVTIIPLFGIQGAVAGRMIVQLLLTVWGFVYVAKSLDCALPLGSLLRLGAAAGACAVSARLIVLQWPNLFGAAFAVGVGAAIYFSLVRGLEALPRDDVRRIREWGDNVPTKFAPAVRPVVKLLFG